MAVYLEGTIKRFIGLSTDRKPYTDPLQIDEVAPPRGSTFKESDTGKIFSLDNLAWRTARLEEQVPVMLGYIFDEMQKQTAILERHTGIQIE